MDIRRLPISPVLPGLLALLFGLTITSMLYVWTRNQERSNEQLLFERRASFRALTIRQGLNDLIEALEVVNNAVTTFHPLSREQFAAFAEPLAQRHPFVSSVSFLRMLPDSDRRAYEQAGQQLRPGFAITELVDGEPRPARRRSHYLVAEHIAPRQDWSPMMGFNAASEPHIAAALERARDTGAAAATGVFRFASREYQPRRFLLVKPVYRAGAPVSTVAERRAALLGFSCIGLPVEILIERILSASSLLPAPGLQVTVYAGAPEDSEHLIYSYAPDASPPLPSWLRWLPMRPQSRFSQNIDLAGLPWIVQVKMQQPMSLASQPGSMLVAAFGTVISLLAAGYLRLLGTGAERIQRLVRERTAALHAANNRLSADIAVRGRIEATLRRTQQSLTNAQRIAHVGSFELDIESGLQFWSEECFRIFGLTPEPGGVPALARLPQETLRIWRNALTRLSTADAKAGLECRIQRPDGSERQVMLHGELLSTPHYQTPVLAGTVLDISDFKQVESELRQSQTSLRELASHQERIKEGERKRIAQEIHDELGGLLTGIKAYVSVAANKTSGRDAAAETLLGEALALSDTALDTVRRVISDLRPSVLDQLGVWEAIAWQASQVEAQTGVPCRCEIDAELAPVDGDNGAMLFRIVQEALTNVARHAAASAVEIRAWQENRQLVLEVEDDGIGIGEQAGSRGPSWGLRGMQERARYLGGTLELRARQGGGTLLRLTMPLGTVSAIANT